MNHNPVLRSFLLVCFLIRLSGLQAQSRDTVRLMHYNVLKYGDVGCASLSTKDGLLRTIFDAYQPDILTLNEIADNPGIAAAFKTNTLKYNSAMSAGLYSNSNGSDIVNLLFYNADKFGLLSQTAIKGNVRDIDIYRLYHKGATSTGDTTDLWCIVAHLKASTGFELDRNEAAQDIIDWLKKHPEVKNYTISGDFNLYSSSEPAWQTLTGPNNGITYFKDPSGRPTGWNGQEFAFIHTQSPSDGVNDCAVTGGMDNRFDFILIKPEFSLPGNNIQLLAGSYRCFGNDGVSYNKSLDCGQTTSVSTQVCLALKRASDHLPVVMGLTFPVNNRDNNAPYAVEIHGNPFSLSSETLRVEINAAVTGPFFWDVFDVLGRWVARGYVNFSAAPAQTFELPLSGLGQGIYFLRVRDNAGHKVVQTFAAMP